MAIIDIDIINYDENICEPLMEFDNINLKLGKINRKDNTLDFIYHEWDILITEIYRILKNEGFVEIVHYKLENKFEGICIENLILGIKHIEKTLESIIKRPFNEIIESLKQEWCMNKSYIKNVCKLKFNSNSEYILIINIST